ncbi:MAG: hypothetical protein KF729_00610 [Sandaracinaceae bacterium]|nr:hypothetical protein [Sandaracinaceae bacterium]
MRRRWIAAWLLCALPVEAAAQDVVVVSLGGDAPAEAAREAREAVAAALVEDELAVLPDADLGLRVPPSRLAQCRASACAYAIGRELGVSMVAAVAAWMTDAQVSSLTVSLIVAPDRSFTATEEVGEAGLVAAARAAVIAAQSSRARAVVLEGSTRPRARVETPEVAELGEAATTPEGTVESPLHADRALEEWILPSLLGAVGLGLIGLGVYALLDRICEAEGRSGECLRGTDPNYGAGGTLTVLGGLAIVGAAIWLVVGGTPASQGNIDVVVGPGGVGVRF